MLTEYSPEDAKRLQQARLERFEPFLLGLSATVAGESLIIQATNPEFAIAQTNILLHQAAIILGTTSLLICSGEHLVFATELESKQLHKSEESMTTATAARSVEFELSPSAATPVVVPWNRITAITGETEAQLRDRIKDSGIPFYWSDDSWALAHETASQLIVRFRTEQGQREAAMLLGEEQASQPQNPARVKKQEAGEVEGATNGHKPKAEKPEFRPLKKGVGPTLEKYLSFVTDNESKQAQILAGIVDENAKGKRHVNKILASYPEDMDKPGRSDLVAAARRLVTKRNKGQDIASPTEEELAQN